MKCIHLLSAILMMLTATAVRAEKNHYELHLGEFTQINVCDNVNVIWTASKDSAGFVRFYGDDRFADAFILSNDSKGVLKIQVASDDINHPELPTLHIYSTYLIGAKSSSSLTVTLNTIPATARLKFSLVGNGVIVANDVDAIRCDAQISTGKGTITLAGKCTDAHFSMTGTGQIRADGLQANNVYCTFMGTGAIFTWPVNLLKAKGMGSTSIYYRGTPSTISKRGGGKLLKLEVASQQPSADFSTRLPLPAQSNTQSTISNEEYNTAEPSTEIEESTEEEEEEEEEVPVYVPRRRN